MGPVITVFLLGVFNLAIGYALAVHLGYGPANLWEAWEALTAERPASPRSEAAERPGELAPELASTPTDSLTRSEPEVALEAEPRDEGLPDTLQPDIAEGVDLDEKYVETSILQLNIAMMKSGARAAEIETRLRACRSRSDLETIGKALADLKQDCGLYLAEQSEAAERFHNRITELSELSALGEEIEIANLEQAAQIETTLSNLEHMDFQSDLEAANHRLLEEIKNLRTARHRLCDKQVAAFLTIAVHQNRLDQVDPRLCLDPLTRLRNRIGLETTLRQWWQEGRLRVHPTSAALFDLDGFGRHNEELGVLVADRVLCQLGRRIEATAGKNDFVARFAGQQFMVVVADLGPRAAIKTTELIRQSIQRVTFVHGQEQFHVTASAGVAEVVPQDTVDTLLKRLEEALHEAKQAGRNRSWLHNGKEPEAIESPSLGAEHVEVQV